MYGNQTNLKLTFVSSVGICFSVASRWFLQPVFKFTFSETDSTKAEQADCLHLYLYLFRRFMPWSGHQKTTGHSWTLPQFSHLLTLLFSIDSYPAAAKGVTLFLVQAKTKEII